MSGGVSRLVLKRKKKQQLAKAIRSGPELHPTLFSNPPLLRHENNDEYLDLARRMAEVIRPRDEVEWYLAKDVIDLSWEIARCRKIKAGILENGRRQAMARIFGGHLAEPLHITAGKLARQWFEDESGRREVEKRLRELGVEPEAVIAQSFVSASADVEMIERIVGGLEARRNRAVHELERWRSNLGRAQPNQVIDVEATVVAKQQ